MPLDRYAVILVFGGDAEAAALVERERSAIVGCYLDHNMRPIFLLKQPDDTSKDLLPIAAPLEGWEHAKGSNVDKRI